MSEMQPESHAPGDDLSKPEKINSTEHLLEWFKTQSKPIFPIGGRSKTHEISSNVAVCDVSEIQGIVAYDPLEFLITACAGTPLSEVISALNEHGQYLPFAPCYAANGATLGGTIASGISGPDRLLYGSIRDFVMEIAMVDGTGRLIRSGGKVVKNTAGFDFPKLVVGSLGRLGILTEVTLKVLPRPAANITLAMDVDSATAALNASQLLQAKPFPLSGIVLDGLDQRRLLVRFSGPEQSMQPTAKRAMDVLSAASGLHNLQRLADEDEPKCWADREPQILSGLERQVLRVVLQPAQMPKLDEFLADANIEREYWSGGEIAWLQCDEAHVKPLDAFFSQNEMTAMRIPGELSGACFLGDKGWAAMANRIADALDPDRRLLRYS